MLKKEAEAIIARLDTQEKTCADMKAQAESLTAWSLFPELRYLTARSPYSIGDSEMPGFPDVSWVKPAPVLGVLPPDVPQANRRSFLLNCTRTRL
ncbi:MAG: hypothetical protein LBC51_08030 [Treponema sp.]|nr:hypothetical protein [Treponema sp.]